MSGLEGLLDSAIAHHAAGRLGDAERDCRRILEVQPSNADALHVLAVVVHARGDDDGALALVRRAIAARDGVADYHNTLGNLLLHGHRPDEATDAYRRAASLDPGFADARYNLGLALEGLGRDDEAAAQYRTALSIDPDMVEARNNLGNVLRREGRPHAAEAAYRAALERAPGHVDAALNLATLLLATDRATQARAVCREAIARTPGSVPLSVALAEAHRLDGDPEAAIEACLAALARDADAADARAGLVAALSETHALAPPPRLEDHLARGFEAGDVELPRLARVLTSVLRWRHGLPPPGPTRIPADDARLGRVIDDSCFRVLLRHTPNVDPDAELALVRCRRALLASEGSDPALACTLALQSWANEYAWAVESAEDRELDALARRLAQALARGASLDSEILVRLLPLYAMYRPPAGLACLAPIAPPAPETLPDPYRAVVRRTLVEPREEAALRARLASLGTIDDRVSRAVRAQYEESPYPRWLAVPGRRRRRYLEVLRSRFPHRQGTVVSRSPVRVLVAGCGTGQHLVNVARSYLDVEVLGVDLSRSSLAYAARMARDLGVDNVRFLHADVLALDALGETFPAIEASGVLHHMADPEAGLRALVARLEPGGAIKLGLYSERARAGVTALRERVRALGYTGHPDDVRRFRRDVLTGAFPLAPAWLLGTPNFYSPSECRDLLFHVREHRFTPSGLARLIESTGLRMLGFQLPDSRTAARYRAAFPDDPEMTDLARWDRFEREHPDTFTAMFQLWCEKPV